MIEAQTIEKPEGGAGFGWIFNHLPVIMWQRRYFVVIPFAIVFLAGLVAAYSLPTMYRSAASLLVQNQQLPTEVVQAPGVGQIEQRIARIRERVLSRGDLISLIEQFGLYAEERRSQPMSIVVDKMRKATAVSALSNDIGQSAGAVDQDVIAVTMSFDYREPALAQAVLQSYVTRFLQMDNETVEDQANLSVRFLQDQSSKLQAQIGELEGQLTALKAANGAALAGSGSVPFMDTGSYTAQIANLENQNRQLLAQARSSSRGDSTLAQAEAALAAARATYSDSHPDVIAARERLQVLRSMSAGSGSNELAAVQEQIRANNAAIASLSAARSAATARAGAAMAGQARAPAIMERAMQIESRLSALRQQYGKISEELLRAQNGARLANEQRAERLTLVEPPNLPDRPHWPNRPLLIAAAAVAGLGLGLLLALGTELIARPMRSPTQVQGLGLPVLGVVPILESQQRPRRRFGVFKKRDERFA
jgi:polysaccharide biosynthesis transport protein